MRQPAVIVTSNAYFPNIGGVENSLRYLAKSYKELGYKVCVVVSDVAPEGVLLNTQEEVEEISIYRYPSFSNKSGYIPGTRALHSSYQAWKLMRKLKQTHDVKLTLSRFHTATVIAKLAGLTNINYLVPGVVKYQNTKDNLVITSGLSALKQKLSHILHQSIQKLAFHLSDNILVFSQNMSSQVCSITGSSKELPILKPGVDTERFTPVKNKDQLKQEHGLPLNKTILLTVGRFVKAKGFDYVIEAMKDLPQCHLVMVGDGENWQHSKELVTNLELEDRITFFGSQPDTTPFYQLSDIFLMSSIYEPLGQTILEALACSLPVFAFDSDKVITATNELLQPQQAIFTNDISAKGISQAITTALSSEVHLAQLSAQSRKLAISQFSWDTLAKETLTLND